MLRKYRLWRGNRRARKQAPQIQFSPDEVKTMVRHGYDVGYQDGKRDGLEAAKREAVSTLGRILKQQQ